MKLSTFIIIIALVGVIFFIYNMAVIEMGQRYNVNINSSRWYGPYDYANDINSSISPLQTAFNNLQDENNGWFSKLTSGISAIPLAVITIPIVIFKGFTLGGEMMATLANDFGIPYYVLTVALIVLVAWGIFKLAEIYQRWQI